MKRRMRGQPMNRPPSPRQAPKRSPSRLSILSIAALLLVAPAANAAVLRIDGEVYARTTSPLFPPVVEDMYQFQITRIAPDGTPVKRGQTVIAFDTSTVIKQLTEKKSQLKEKQSQLDQLNLELAERERTERLKTVEAESNREKAQRKTEQPAELIAGMQYRKLLVARAQMERKHSLMQRREQLSAEQRRQERRLVASLAAQLQADVDRLQASIAAMNVIAPRDGWMMHKSSWNRDKLDVGSQVWRGQTIAEIPDPTTLAVRAQLPERDYARVRIGTVVRIVVEGSAGSVYRGKVVDIGRAVRSKSSIQPVPVLDMDIALVDAGARLKPGQAVRVELNVADAVANGGAQ